MDGYRIKTVTARRIYDSRANPAVEVDIRLEDGTLGRGMVPSGASTGKYEALELRDGGGNLGGKGVDKALRNIRESLAPALIGMDAGRQREIDGKMIELDGSANKANLGANAILGCSLAACRAAANHRRLPLYAYLGGALAATLPVPMVQIIGGGAHAAHAVDIQDYLVIPLGEKTFAAAYEKVVNVYIAARRLFAEQGKPLSLADEGGLWPTGFKSNEEGVALLTESIARAGYRPGRDLAIALDVAASEFYDREAGVYRLNMENRELSREQFIGMLCDWVDRYPIVSIEDGASEHDWEGARMLTDRLGGRVQLIGDDLFATNVERIRRGVNEGCYNAVLVKMNQIGTISETFEAINYARGRGYLPVVSARSGETEDATVVHLAVAANAGQLKVGSAARGERTAKWNEAIRVEEELGPSGRYPGAGVFLDAGIAVFGK
ncbi:MAG: phosphopyruvate hydratase [Planctomycetota bacterium]|jgi:enolase|nr:phosphopyruvate hydratase [Planctomycetota bacterium]